MKTKRQDVAEHKRKLIELHQAGYGLLGRGDTLDAAIADANKSLGFNTDDHLTAGDVKDTYNAEGDIIAIEVEDIEKKTT